MGLCISRKVGEFIQISDNIRVTLIHVDRGKVRLHIEAPREIIILRGELLEEGSKDQSSKE